MSPQTSPDDSPMMAAPISATPGKTTTVHAGPAAVYQKLPPIVRQSLPDSCWAAALESWLVVNPDHGNGTQEELIKAYSTRSDGGIEESDFDEARALYGIDEEKKESSRVNASFLANKLRSFGHVLTIYRASGTFWHTHLVYGVGYPNGGTDPLISLMDPGSGKYESVSESFYRGKSGTVLVAWPRLLTTP